MQYLMNNPYAWAILSLCTIFSLVFGIYTWIVGKRKREISVDFLHHQIITKANKTIDNFKIEFSGKKIETLTVSTIYLWNSGNEVIDIEDIVNKEITIICNDSSLLDAKIIKQSDESNDFVIQNISPQEIKIKFEYIDVGEGVKIQILHEDNKEISFSFKIKGGKKIRNCSQLKKEKSFGWSVSNK